MTYNTRMEASARRITRHLGNEQVTITQRVAGGSATPYTTRGKTLTESRFFELTGTEQVGDLIVMVVRASDAWNPSRVTPAEGDKVAIGSRTGTIKKAHEKVPVWILDCKQASTA